MTRENEAELLEAGELEPIATLAQRLTGQRPSRPTIWRWTRKGVAGGITLPARFAFNAWRTTEAAFRDFLDRRSEAMLQSETVPPATDDDLRAAGLL